jgi:Ni/Co efflux regulator RcnB
MKRTILFVVALATAGLGMATSADANWRTQHPRRAEVNARLNNQARRIHMERKEGEITVAQAHDLHVEDRGIRAQERFDASRNGGHITRAEQARLNHQENQISGQIGR